MKTTFFKYQGTGNDFIIIDNRLQRIDKNNTKRIAELCNRHYGIGADGFILLEDDNTLDFKMVYYNADGNESSMCGNGGRCITAFAKYLGIIENEAKFRAIDGIYEVKVEIERNLVHLKMQDVSDIEVHSNHVFLDTGSPHHVEMVRSIKNEHLDVKEVGRRIRYQDPYNMKGANVNFVELLFKDCFGVRTYERGVEDETLSCGTGATAVAIAMHRTGMSKARRQHIQTRGGALYVTYDVTHGKYSNIWLIGPAEQVFKGTIEW